MATKDKGKLDLIDESDRGAVIVAAAILENELDVLLNDIIQKNKVSKKTLKDMFDLNGPLSSFSSKALIYYGFGLISKDIFNDLTKIRKLRNKFAHSPDDVDFLSDEIKDIVLSLKCTSDVSNKFEGKRYSPSDKKKYKDWEMRSKGYVKYTKAVFCLGITVLQIEIKKYHIENVLKNAT